MNLGFIGLGNIGQACAQHLVKNDFSFWVHDRRREVAEDLCAQGAIWCESAAQLAQECDVVFLSLPGPAQVETVLFAEGGIAESAPSTLVVVDLSTITLDSAVSNYERAKKSGLPIPGFTCFGWRLGDRSV